MPLMVPLTPEGWILPSVIAVCFSAGNIADAQQPVGRISNRFAREKSNESAVVASDEDLLINTPEVSLAPTSTSKDDTRLFLYLLFLHCLICLVLFDFLPSLTTYTGVPYGQKHSIP
jgi:hypothetical protein